MKKQSIRLLISISIIIAVGLTAWGLYLHLVIGHQWAGWTGFGEQSITKKTNEVKSSGGTVTTTETVTAEKQEGKTLWDWMGLLIVPTVLAGAAFLLNRGQKESELRATKNKQQEDALQSYFNQMTDLLLTHKLSESTENEKMRVIARARTLTTLRELDGRRKGFLMRFLVEARLIQEQESQLTYGEGDKLPVIKLQGAVLGDADLREMDFSRVRLSGVDLRGADLRQANLRDAVTDEHTQLDEKWQLVLNIHKQGILLPKDALRGKDLREANLRRADLKEVDLRGTDLTDANLEYVNFKDSRIDSRTRISPKWRTVWEIINQKAKLADLKGSNLRSAYLVVAPLNHGQLQKSDLTFANMRYAQLQDANLSGARLVLADMEGAHMPNAILEKASGVGVKLGEANLEEAILKGANLHGAKLRHANLVKADLSNAKLRKADLRGAKLVNAILDNTDLKGSEYDRETEWPSGFDPEKHGSNEVIEGSINGDTEV